MTQAFDTERISYIKKHLYIGSWKAGVYATNPEKLGIPDEHKMDVVISALTEEEYEYYDLIDDDFEDVMWYRIVVDDYLFDPISDHFERVHHIIKNANIEGKNVLVHCAAGISRSPTLVAAHLLLDRQFDSVEDTLKYIKKMRYVIEPNMGFEKQLEDLEESIKNK
jgi:protein-tyrosine phosphatase